MIAESLTLLVTTQVEGSEAVVANGKFLGGGVGSGLQDGDTVVLFECSCQKIALPVSSPEWAARCIVQPQRWVSSNSQIVRSIHIQISTHLQHVQQGSLSRIIESEE